MQPCRRAEMRPLQGTDRSLCQWLLPSNESNGLPRAAGHGLTLISSLQPAAEEKECIIRTCASSGRQWCQRVVSSNLLNVQHVPLPGKTQVRLRKKHNHKHKV